MSAQVPLRRRRLQARAAQARIISLATASTRNRRNSHAITSPAAASSHSAGNAFDVPISCHRLTTMLRGERLNGYSQ